MYIDPSGHTTLCGATCEAEYEKPQYTLDQLAAKYGITFTEDGKKWNATNKAAAIVAAMAIAKKFGKETGRDGVTVFREVYGSLTFEMVDQYKYDGQTYKDGACACGGTGKIFFASFYGWDDSYSRSWDTTMEMNRNLVAHELGHVFDDAIGNTYDGLSRDALIPNSDLY